MTSILFVLTLILLVAVGITLGLLFREQAKNTSLSSQLASSQADHQSRVTSLDEQLTKCKQSHAALRAKAEQKITQLNSTLVECQRHNQTIANRADTLDKTVIEQREKMKRWQVLVDAEAEARRILAEATAATQQLQNEAERIMSDATSRAEALNREIANERTSANNSAKQMIDAANNSAANIRHSARHESDSVLASAHQMADELTKNAKKLLDDAQRRAATIIADAEVKARDIAGEAYDVKQNVSKYERTLRAIKNEIEGYGDEYIIPTHSLLDDLAEEFGHSQAGQELKAARDRVKSMVKTGQAAECDYVETNRRETAIRFVVDAFNGKVDSILSLAKHDNFGKLSQQIKDAGIVVNSNGEAFRNARVKNEYLDARLDELKWATITHELKKQEQEEQRRIKEQIREEEKARREYERAIKEAAREEELVQKAMAKLQQQIEKASADQRANYENQLKELQEKLRAAEEKGQRAISMAQQTKCGYVYIISNIGSFGDHVFKIGLTRRLEPLDRVRELGDSSVPFEFDVHALIKSDDAPALEYQLHRHFLIHQVNKVNHRKEFFRCDLATIREEVEKLGLQTQWTMLAEAHDYRETLAIERKIAEDPLAREQWLQRQFELDPTDIDSERVSAGVAEDDEDA